MPPSETAAHPQRPFVRLVLAISLDGRLAPAEGGPAKLGGAGDRIELERALVWADACLLGAGTLRAHQCTCLIRNPAFVQQRLDEARPAQPPALVVSHHSAFPLHWPFFEQPLERWLLAPAPAIDGFIAGFRCKRPGRIVLACLPLRVFRTWCCWAVPNWLGSSCRWIAWMNSSSPWFQPCWEGGTVGCPLGRDLCPMRIQHQRLGISRKPDPWATVNYSSAIDAGVAERD